MRRFLLALFTASTALPFHLIAADAAGAPPAPVVLVAQGEAFTPLDDKGWALTPQDESLASHTYGGMWVVNGAVLGAPAESVGSVAEYALDVPVAADFRVWSKYQAPPYHEYLHRLEVIQGGKTVFSHDYGTMKAERMWSFSTKSDELFWFWGVDHDAAEAPTTPVSLAAGPATLRLTTLAGGTPGGPRMVDFVVLTTELADTYTGFKPYKCATPFAFEAFAASSLYMRFKNGSAEAAQLAASRKDHFQPNYGGAKMKWPAEPVAAGAWSEWMNVGPSLRLVHNDALWLTLPGADTVAVEFARDAAGKDLVGQLMVPSGESVTIPLDITWNQESKVRLTQDLIAETIAAAKAWPKWNGGKKPSKFLFFGAFRGPDSAMAMKDALGYNTQLPDEYEHVSVDGYFQHAGDEKKISALAEKLMQSGEAEHFKVLSFGDEIHLGKINAKDPAVQAAFTAWLQAHGVGEAQLGMPVADAKLTDAATSAHVHWYATQFSEQQRFAHFKALTAQAKEEIGPQVLTGANYSPHSLTLYYGPLGQWEDIFRADGMTMYWSEDYVFSVPEPPSILSWHFAMMNAAVRHNGQPIHYYVMPHAPGQPASMLRRNMLFAAGNGATQIDSFWVGPQEYFTENYVAWQYQDSFKAIHDAIYQTAEVEDILTTGKLRPAKVALVLSKATQVNEDAVKVDKAADAFASRSANAPAQIGQTLCRKEQQALYLALREMGVEVDLITEDDISERQVLGQYQVVYFAGEWVDTAILPPLRAWVEAGGSLFASAGLGHLNQFNEPETGMLDLLGVAASPIAKSMYFERTLLELPVAEPVGTLTLADYPDDQAVPMIGWKQSLAVKGKSDVLATWADGSPAAVMTSVGKGHCIAFGGLPGVSWLKSGLKPVPFARGGNYGLYHPSGFHQGLQGILATSWTAGGKPGEGVKSMLISVPGVEGRVIESPAGSVLTLVNWHIEPQEQVKVSLKLAKEPTQVRSISQRAAIPFTWTEGSLHFTVDVKDADYILLK